MSHLVQRAAAGAERYAGALLRFCSRISPATQLQSALFRWLIGFGCFGTYLFFLEAPRFFLSAHALRDLPDAVQLAINGSAWTSALLGFLGIGLGFRLRASAALALAGHLYLEQHALFAYWGWSRFVFYPLIIMIVVPFKDAYALDGRRSADPPTTLPWIGQFTVEICLSAMYFSTVLIRWGDPYWTDGSILRHILESRIFSRLTFIDWSSFDGSLKILSHFGLALECLGGVLFLLPFWPKRALILGLLGLHLILHVAGFLGPWQLVIAACLVAIWPTTPARRPWGVVRAIWQEARFRPVVCLWVGIVVQTYVASLPLRLVPLRLAPFVVGARTLSRFTGTRNLVNANMMHTRPSFAAHLVAWAARRDGRIDTLFATSPGYVTGQLRFVVDGVYQGLYAAYLNSTMRKFELELPERLGLGQAKMTRYAQRTGFALCQWAGGKETIESVALSVTALETSADAGPAILDPRVFFVFDCASERISYAIAPGSPFHAEASEAMRELRRLLGQR